MVDRDVAPLGERLTMARRARGLTVEALAAEAGVGKRTIEEIVHPPERPGRVPTRGPTLDTVLRLARGLGVSVGWLVASEGEGP